MDYENYYDECRSEADEIIDESVLKIVGIIKEKAKNEINDSLQAAARTNETNFKLYADLAKSEQEVDVLQREVERLTSELEAVKKSPIHTQFKVGDKVQIIVNSDKLKLNCDTCRGEGYIDVDYNGETLRALCPTCKDSHYGRGKRKNNVEYYSVKSAVSEIEGIHAHYRENEELQWSYELEGCAGYYEVYSMDTDMKPIIEKVNKDAYEKALAELNGEDVM